MCITSVPTEWNDKTPFGAFGDTTSSKAESVEHTAHSLWSTNQPQKIADLTAFSSDRAIADYDHAGGIPAQMPGARRPA